MSQRIAALLTIVALGGGPSGAFAQTTNINLVPVADAFIRAEAPFDNYGRAGSLCVAGALATNGSNAPSGQFDSLLRFSPGDTVSSLDMVFRERGWFVAR